MPASAGRALWCPRLLTIAAPSPHPAVPVPCHPRRIAALLLFAALLVTGRGGAQPAGAGSSAGAGPSLHVHVRGGAELHAVAGVERGGLTFHGQLVDDAGTPIPKAIVVVQASSAEEPRGPLQVGPLRPCEDAASGARPLPRGGPDELLVETDERGEFCAVARATAPRMILKLRFGGAKLYDPAELAVPVDAAEPRLLRTILRFEPPPETLDLDRDAITVTAKLSFDRSDAARQGTGDEGTSTGPGARPRARPAQPGRSEPGADEGAALRAPIGAAQRVNLALTLTDERGAHIADGVHRRRWSSTL